MKIITIPLFVLLLVPSIASAQPACDPADLITYLETRLTDLSRSVAQVSDATVRQELAVITGTVRAYRETCHPELPAQAPESRESRFVYILGSSSANIRAEPSTTASIIGAAPGGSTVQTFGTVTGQSVSGSTFWYEVNHDGEVGYIHSSLITTTRPVARPSTTTTTQQQPAAPDSVQQPVIQPTQPPPPAQPANTVRPDNCAHAVAMGLTAQQAAQWPHLDRDKDGVACYGD